MRVLVTGADGFAGRHLVPYLRAQGDSVVAAAGPHSAGSDGYDARLDVTDAAAARRVIAETRPDAVIHLAGFSSVSRSHREPGLTYLVNAVGTVNLLDAVREAGGNPRIVVVSSGEVYGTAAARGPVDEDQPCVATSPYSASKLSAELAAQQFHSSYGVAAIIARPFNHLGSGQDESFVVPSFARQIQAMKSGAARPVLKTGNLDAVRDFSHVSDVVAAYRLLASSGEPGQIYNIASGVGRTIRSLVDELAELAGVKLEVELDPERLRPSEIPTLVGASQKLRALGWTPRKTVREALSDALHG